MKQAREHNLDLDIKWTLFSISSAQGVGFVAFFPDAFYRVWVFFISLVDIGTYQL